MFRKALALLVVAVVSCALALGPVGSSPVSAKSKKSSSVKTSKKDKKGKKDKKAKKDKKSKKDKSRKDKKGAKSKDKSKDKSKKDKSSDKHAAKKADPPSPKISRSTNDQQVADRRQPQPSYVSKGGDDDDGDDDADEPDLPRPANRVVSDISSTRVQQIQNALIKQGLLPGPPNGVYDQATFNAMATFQSRNGWNPVGVPTASSLKALGLPKNSGRAYPSPSRVVDETAPQP